jgi:16S rRNA (guanine527-N7)-methyltransferase
VNSQNCIAACYRELCQHLVGLELVRQSSVAVELKAGQIGQLDAFVSLLERWTTKVDLVSPAPRDVLVQRHIVDCLAARLLLADERAMVESGSYLDIGTGAGLPGIVLAILEPERKIILCEPRQKRAVFLKEVRKELGLDNAMVLAKRSENISTDEVPGLKAVFERALGREKEFLADALRLLLPGGVAVQMVGPSWESAGEGRLVSEPGTLNLEKTISYTLAMNGVERKLALWRRFT